MDAIEGYTDKVRTWSQQTFADECRQLSDGEAAIRSRVVFRMEFIGE